MNRLLFREELCMGCGLCEVYCLTQHSKSKDIIKAHVIEKPRSLSRVKVMVDRPSSFAVQCRHCEEAPCVMVCLSGAMHRDVEKGLVVHDAEKCRGCWTCIMVCPYGAIRMDVANRRVVAKCDLCKGLQIPVCVANCPNEALVYQEVVT